MQLEIDGHPTGRAIAPGTHAHDNDDFEGSRDSRVTFTPTESGTYYARLWSPAPVPSPDSTPRTKIPSFLKNSDYILRLTIDPEVNYVKKLVTRCRMSDACR